jgi:hypothetical protein
MYDTVVNLEQETFLKHEDGCLLGLNIVHTDVFVLVAVRI